MDRGPWHYRDRSHPVPRRRARRRHVERHDGVRHSGRGAWLGPRAARLRGGGGRAPGEPAALAGRARSNLPRVTSTRTTSRRPATSFARGSSSSGSSSTRSSSFDRAGGRLPCTGLSLPAGETAYHFNTSRLMVHGQSMGAMYAEPHLRGGAAHPGRRRDRVRRVLELLHSPHAERPRHQEPHPDPPRHAAGLHAAASGDAISARLETCRRPSLASRRLTPHSRCCLGLPQDRAAIVVEIAGNDRVSVVRRVIQHGCADGSDNQAQFSLPQCGMRMTEAR